MTQALRLARRGLGATAENPAVGCVIVTAEGEVAGVGWTAPGGRPHAETIALTMAGDRARAATAYVTLEPCSHTGRTGPCADALIAAGIARVVAATGDPDVRVAGQGFSRLRHAGVAVETGVCEASARAGLAGYLSRQTRSRPHVQLKLAMSRDAKIAAAPGQRTAITGDEARRFTHLLRAEADAILVGVSTVAADDPQLTCRLPGMAERSPVRIVADSRLSIDEQSRVVTSAGETPTWILACRGADADKADRLAAMGVTVVFTAATAAGKVDLHDALFRLATRGVNTLMCEGGAHMARALLEEDLVDEAIVLTSPDTIGEAGLDALAGLPLTALSASPLFARADTAPLGRDTMTRYQRTRKEPVMFTGIVTDIGEVIDVTGDGSLRLKIACNYNPATIDIGASIACAGVCLTVTAKGETDDGRGWFAVDVSAETLARTAIATWRPGEPVNLERALRLGEEVGGHMVSGHVDGLAEIIDTHQEGSSRIFRFRVDDDLARFIAPKGSVALDGTSLTVNHVEDNAFDVTIIPHTLAVTTWGRRKVGDKAHIEIDMLARYVARMAG